MGPTPIDDLGHELIEAAVTDRNGLAVSRALFAVVAGHPGVSTGRWFEVAFRGAENKEFHKRMQATEALGQSPVLHLCRGSRANCSAVDIAGRVCVHCDEWRIRSEATVTEPWAIPAAPAGAPAAASGAARKPAARFSAPRGISAGSIS